MFKIKWIQVIRKTAYFYFIKYRYTRNVEI